MERTSITRIWIGLAEESVQRLAGHPGRVEAPEVQDALDRAAEWAIGYLREHDLDVTAGHDGALKTLDFKTEDDCLEAHERLLAADERRRPFALRFVLKPRGVTILVVT